MPPTPAETDPILAEITRMVDTLRIEPVRLVLGPTQVLENLSRGGRRPRAPGGVRAVLDGALGEVGGARRY